MDGPRRARGCTIESSIVEKIAVWYESGRSSSRGPTHKDQASWLVANGEKCRENLASFARRGKTSRDEHGARLVAELRRGGFPPDHLVETLRGAARELIAPKTHTTQNPGRAPPKAPTWCFLSPIRTQTRPANSRVQQFVGIWNFFQLPESCKRNKIFRNVYTARK